MSQGEDSSQKWASLLQPIKELEKNWDIDIADQLKDYLEELSGLTFTVDGLTNLNFAEAAVVVYSSSCTYGKKVEYLLKLTLAALENARAKQKENSASRSKRKGLSNPEPDELLGVEHLLLTVEAAGCVEHQLDADAMGTLEVPEPEPALLAQVSHAASMPTVAHQAGHVRLDLAYQSTASAMSASDAPSFNMLNSHQHVSGALLLMQCDGNHWDEELVDITDTAQRVAPPVPGLALRLAGFGSPMPRVHGSSQIEVEVHNDATLACVDSPNEPEISLAANLWYGDDGHGDFDHPEEMPAPVEQDNCPGPPSPGKADEGISSRDIFDPYTELDPHCPDAADDKPYKKMVPKEPSFSKSTKQACWLPFKVAEDMSMAEWRIQLLLPDLMARPLHPGHQNVKRREPLQRLPGRMLPGPALEAEQLPEVATSPQREPNAWLDTGLRESDATPEAFAFDDGGDDHGSLDADRMEMGLEQAAIFDRMEGPSNAQGVSYDNLVLQYTQAVAAASVEFAQSRLSKKITTWRETINKVMIEQDRRPAFNIQDIGKAMVDETAQLSKRGQQQLDFKSILHCKHKYEVARCFSAFLQQVNSATVEVLRGKSPADPFFVKLGKIGLE